MPLPKELTTVTKLSKSLALLLFVTLPILGFFLGKNYQSNLDTTAQPNIQQTYQFVPTIRSKGQPISQSISPTTNTALPNNQKTCSKYQDKYFTICYPKSWRMLPETNKGPNELELLSLMQSKTENDGTALGNSYAIHVLSNIERKSALAFAKNDIVTSWEEGNGPTYTPYSLNNLDAVVVENINVGKGAWGPSIYIVTKSIAIQIIAENPINLSTDKYFKSVVNTFSFSNPNDLSELHN